MKQRERKLPIWPKRDNVSRVFLVSMGKGGVPSLPSIVSAAVAAISVVARHVIWDIVVVMARMVVVVVVADTF